MFAVDLLLSQRWRAGLFPLMRISESSTKLVPQSGILAVIGLEGGVMNGVMRGSINARNAPRDAVVYVHGPAGDDDEGSQVDDGVKRDEEDENEVGKALSKAVDRVESKGCKRGCVDEGVMRLVKGLVQERVMQRSVHKVDDAVTEGEKQQRRNEKIRIAVLGWVVVYLPVP